jgi:hypothetical protein
LSQDNLTQEAQAAISRQQQAEWILDHPLFKEALQELEQRYFEKWINQPDLTKEEREEIWRMVKAMQHLKGLMKEYIAKGQQAYQTLALLNSQIG